MSCAKVVKGDLVIDVQTLIANLPKETQNTIARFVGADTDVWRAMCEALVSSSGSFNEDDPEGHWWMDTRSMQECRAKLIPLMPDIAAVLCAKALDAQKYAEKQSHEWQEWANARAGWFSSIDRLKNADPVKVRRLSDLHVELRHLSLSIIDYLSRSKDGVALSSWLKDQVIEADNVRNEIAALNRELNL